MIKKIVMAILSQMPFEGTYKQYVEDCAKYKQLLRETELEIIEYLPKPKENFDFEKFIKGLREKRTHLLIQTHILILCTIQEYYSEVIEKIARHNQNTHSKIEPIKLPMQSIIIKVSFLYLELLFFGKHSLEYIHAIQEICELFVAYLMLSATEKQICATGSPLAKSLINDIFAKMLSFFKRYKDYTRLSGHLVHLEEQLVSAQKSLKVSKKKVFNLMHKFKTVNLELYPLMYKTGVRFGDLSEDQQYFDIKFIEGEQVLTISRLDKADCTATASKYFDLPELDYEEISTLFQSKSYSHLSEYNENEER